MHDGAEEGCALIKKHGNNDEQRPQGANPIPTRYELVGEDRDVIGILRWIDKARTEEREG